MRFEGGRPIILAVFLILGVAPGSNRATERGHPGGSCNHGGNDLWEVLRLRPVHFTEFDGNIARWKYEDEYNLKFGSFVLLENARYVAKGREVTLLYLKQRRDAQWLCYYCSVCQALLRAHENRVSS